MPRAKKTAPKYKEKTKTVHPGVIERHIGGDKPYFQVRIRPRNQKTITQKFPYLPENGLVPETDLRTGMRRSVALQEAITFASKERGNLHYYGKPSDETLSEQTLRTWIRNWIREVLDREDVKGNPLPHPQSKEAIGNHLAVLPIRKAAKSDKSLLVNLMLMADENASINRSKSIMDKRVIDLRKHDFNGPNGLINLLTGRRLRDKDGNLLDTKPPASAETKRRMLATLGSIWNHASEHWGMSIDRPWKDIIIRSQEVKPEVRILTAKEFVLVEEALEKTDDNTKAAIAFVRWTAARKGEMTKLRWETIQWPTNPKDFPTITFEGTKTPRQGAYKERTIHLMPGAVEALRMVNPNTDGTWPKSGIVFKSPTDSSKPISGYTVYQALIRAVKRAGLKHAHIHSLRHSRTTEISAVLSTAQGMEITGHTEERTYMRYKHLESSVAESLLEADTKRIEKAKSNQQNTPSMVNNGEVVQTLLLEAFKELTAEQRLALIQKLVSG